VSREGNRKTAALTLQIGEGLYPKAVWHEAGKKELGELLQLPKLGEGNREEIFGYTLLARLEKKKTKKKWMRRKSNDNK